jgi:hypothetical protein
MKPLWFFHIPKTSGRFFYENTIKTIEEDLGVIGREHTGPVRGFDHLSFKPVDDGDILSFSIIREPVARTISHWYHLYINNHSEIGGSPLADYSFRIRGANIEEDKEKLFSFLESNPDSGIINYQTKFISYSGNTYRLGIDESELTTSNLELAKKRIALVDYLFDSKDVSHAVAEKSLAIMRNHFNIKHTPYIGIDMDHAINEHSTEMYNSLTKKEKLIIEEYMADDLELYHSARFS